MKKIIVTESQLVKMIKNIINEQTPTNFNDMKNRFSKMSFRKPPYKYSTNDFISLNWRHPYDIKENNLVITYGENGTDEFMFSLLSEPGHNICKDIELGCGLLKTIKSFKSTDYRQIPDLCYCNSQFNIKDFEKNYGPLETSVPDLVDRLLKIIHANVKPPIKKECKDFPYVFGCKSDIIKDVQRCLNLVDDGIFGPKTRKALKTKYGVDVLDKDTYDKIMDDCKKDKKDDDVVIPPVKDEKEKPKPIIIKPTKYDGTPDYLRGYDI
jgi:hypothetical protein